MTGAQAPATLVPRCHVVLYVAGESPNSVLALANLRAAIAASPAHDVELDIIDVLVEPERAGRAGILMTPMLVRVSPAPEHRILGNLRDRAILLRTLGLDVPRE